MTRAVWTSAFLENWSESLPQIGVVAVIVSRVATTTQVYSVWLPCRLSTIRGSAFETTVLESIATNIASRRPDMASSTSRWVIAPLVSTARRRDGLDVAGLGKGTGCGTDCFLMRGITVDLGNYIPRGRAGPIRERSRTADDPQVWSPREGPSVRTWDGSPAGRVSAL